MVTNESQLEHVHRLRYQVYCVENEFESAEDNPDGLEKDEFDVHSVHSLLVHRPTNLYAGTVRLVLPVANCLEDCLPIQHVCDDPVIRDASAFPIATTAEVSRFSISKQFRKRREDSRYPSVANTPAKMEFGYDERRVLPHMTLGLIESLVRMSIDNSITHWAAVMEPALLRLLSRLGIYFEPIGSIVNYHGRRQPCHIDLATMLERVRKERPDVWEVLTEGGTLWERMQVQRTLA